MITAKQAVSLGEQRRKAEAARERAEEAKKKAQRKVDEAFLKEHIYPKKLKEIEQAIKAATDDYITFYVDDDWRGELLCTLLIKELESHEFKARQSHYWQRYEANMDAPDTPEAMVYTLHIWWSDKGYRSYLREQDRRG
jgi:hypothetical protein